MKKKKYLVTGGAGMVGSNIVKKLCRQGAEVTVLDNLSAYPFDYFNGFGVGRMNSVHFITGDILNKTLVCDTIKRVDIVIHAAAYADVEASIKNYDLDFQNNVVGTHHIIDACKKYGIKKFVFISSASVYGAGGNGAFIESQPVCPISTYANSKLWGERQTKLFYELYGVPTTSLRYFSVYGSPQVPKKGSHSWCIAIFAMLAKKRKSITVYGDGNQIRDFIHVSDIADATILAAEKESTNGKIINIGTGKQTNINEIVKKVISRFNRVPIQYKPLPSGDPLGGYANTVLMEKLLNWKPKISLDEGFEEYCDWLDKNQHMIPDWL